MALLVLLHCQEVDQAEVRRPGFTQDWLLSSLRTAPELYTIGTDLITSLVGFPSNTRRITSYEFHEASKYLDLEVEAEMVVIPEQFHLETS